MIIQFPEFVLSLPAWQGFIVALALTIVSTVIIGMLMLAFTERILSRVNRELDEKLFTHLHRPTYLTVFFGGLYASVLTLGLSLNSELLLKQLCLSILLLLWSQALWKSGETVTEVDSTTRYMDEAFLPIFNNLWKVGVIVGLFVGGLTIWGIDVTPLLASAGVLGIAIGFAAKDTISNFFGGVALYFDNTYQKGDYIVLESGDEGTVIDVGIRSTVLLTREGIRITVPNSILNNALVTNESAPQQHRRISIPVGVAYGTDIDHLREVLTDIADNDELVREQPPTRVHFQDMGDFALDIELRVWIDRPSQRIKATNQLNTTIYKRFREEGIEIPFPRRDVRFRDDT